jgi:hypothetical protein
MALHDQPKRYLSRIFTDRAFRTSKAFSTVFSLSGDKRLQVAGARSD